MLATALNAAFYPSNRMTWIQAFLLAAAAAPGGFLLFAALYLAKSALGINLMPGPSPVHDILFWVLV